MRLLRASLAGALFVLLVLAPEAWAPHGVDHAYLPPCAPGVAEPMTQQFLGDVTDQAVVGKRQIAELPTPNGGAWISLVPATETPITNSFESRPIPLFEQSAGSPYRLTFVLEPGDGPATLIYTWDDWDRSCRATVSKTISPIAGGVPRVRVSIKDDWNGSGFDLVWWDFRLSEGRPGKVVLEAWAPNRGRLRVQSFEDAPFRWERGSVKNKTFSLGVELRSHMKKGRALVEFDSELRRTGRYRVFYRASVDGRVVNRGSFRVRTRRDRMVPARKVYYKAKRRVWQGTDEFFNYCIKKGKETYSEGGRLYCWRTVRRYKLVGGNPGSTRVQISGLREVPAG